MCGRRSRSFFGSVTGSPPTGVPPPQQHGQDGRCRLQSAKCPFADPKPAKVLNGRVLKGVAERCWWAWVDGAFGLRCSCAHGEVVHVGHGLDGVVEAGSFLRAVAEDLEGLHPGEGVLDAGSEFRCSALSASSPGSRDRPGRLRCGTTRPVLMYAPSPRMTASRHCSANPEARQVWALALLPGFGRAAATTRRVSASMMTCRQHGGTCKARANPDHPRLRGEQRGHQSRCIGGVRAVRLCSPTEPSVDLSPQVFGLAVQQGIDANKGVDGLFDLAGQPEDDAQVNESLFRVHRVRKMSEDT